MRRLNALFVPILISAATLAGGATMAQSKGPDAGTQTVSSGGRYRLMTNSSSAGDTVSVRVRKPGGAALSGGQYRLERPAAPAADGSGCCCKTYLPHIAK
jgi:hypothetical protein